MADSAQYGIWETDLDIRTAVDRSNTPSYPFKFNGKLHWVESINEEGGRSAIVCASDEKTKTTLTPEEFNIRTRVHEYGGKCLVVHQHWVIFNNYSDNSLYYQNLKTASYPQILFDSKNVDGCCGFADLVICPSTNLLIAVTEQSMESLENKNSLISLSLECGENLNVKRNNGILAESADFYACPSINVCSSKIAWIEWSHPYMPWDQSRLMIADLVFANGNVELTNQSCIVDKDNWAVSQAGFIEDGGLIFCSDNPESDFSNIYQYSDGHIETLTDDRVEYGEAHWAFGQSRWVQLEDQRVFFIATKGDGDKIVELNKKEGMVISWAEIAAEYSHINRGDDNEVVYLLHSEDRPVEIHSFRPSEEQSGLGDEAELKKQQHYSRPLSFEYITTQSETAHGYFYPPYNRNYENCKYSLPPLIVTIHGGPTGRTNAQYNGLKQYFCSLGFAVLDINHRGSTGYGRKFRQSLLGQWGVVDVEDIVSGISHVVEQKWVDPNLIFIRGSSAGGYAVMRALTEAPTLFSAGACYYGIGNLITLSELTHKFESHYTDRLIGEVFHPIKSRMPASNFVQRSPINYMNKISCPLIIFQGKDDKVVPPNLALEMVEHLKQKGISYRYTEYPSEGHGFRIQENRIDSLKKETEFFQSVIQSRHSN